MRPKRIVLALGGNTLGRTLPEQRAAARDLAASLGELLQGESQLVVVHGTGPQVGMLQQAMDALTREDPGYPPTPLAVCTAMSQGYLGGTLQDALREELRRRGITHLPVVYSPEEASEPDTGETPPPGRRSIPASNPWVPAAAGLLLGSAVVRDLIQQERED